MILYLYVHSHSEFLNTCNTNSLKIKNYKNCYTYKSIFININLINLKIVLLNLLNTNSIIKSKILY